MQTFCKVIEFFSPVEPLSQNSSYLHESFLTKCRFKLVQILVHEGQGGGHKGGELFLHWYIHYWKESYNMKHLANFNQTRYNHILHDGNSSLFK
jgi:hypothetical protein